MAAQYYVVSGNKFFSTDVEDGALSQEGFLKGQNFGKKESKVVAVYDVNGDEMLFFTKDGCGEPPEGRDFSTLLDKLRRYAKSQRELEETRQVMKEVNNEPEGFKGKNPFAVLANMKT